jgi:diacylglycerol kinase (ATP)
MQKQHHAVVIRSPHAGRAVHLSEALTLLEQAGVKVAEVLSIAALDSLPPQGAVWRERGVTLAIAAGGDGVVGGVITHLAASGLPLGILPLGTANDIARSLCIPQPLPQAVEVIAQGHTRPIDVGVAQPAAQAPHYARHAPIPASEVSQKRACFAHALTVGLNVEFARIATNVATRQRFGRLAYPVAALEAVRTHEALEVELHFDGLSIPPTIATSAPLDAPPVLRCRALQVTVINAPLFGGHWQLTIPEASFNDHLLDIVVIEELEIGDLNKGLAQLFHPEEQAAEAQAAYLSRHPAELTGFPGIHHLQARGVTITTSLDPQDVTLDGEIRGQTPMHVQVAPEPLHVVAPIISREPPESSGQGQ